MSTSISFTDSIGAATLTNGKPTPGDRFGNWQVMSEPIGESVTLLATGALAMFKFRDQYGASFELSQIPVATTGGQRLVDIADRLVAYLKGGGTCTVTTGDAESNVYATCGLAPGTTPSLVCTDRQNLEYTLTLALINLAASPVRMVCHYAS